MDVQRQSPTLEDLVSALRPVLRRGLPVDPDLDDDRLLGLRGVFARAVDPDDRFSRVNALDGLIRLQLAYFQDDVLGEPARVIFGLTPGTRGKNLTDRQAQAARELSRDPDHFRKVLVPKILRQLAWQLHQDAQTYTPRARDVPPPLAISGDTPYVSKGDVSSKERAEHEELLSRLWADVYTLRAEILRVERLKAWPYDEAEAALSQGEMSRAIAERERAVAAVRSHIRQYIETYGTRIQHGEGEFNAEALLRLAGWRGV